MHSEIIWLHNSKFEKTLYTGKTMYLGFKHCYKYSLVHNKTVKQRPNNQKPHIFQNSCENDLFNFFNIHIWKKNPQNISTKQHFIKADILYIIGVY